MFIFVTNSVLLSVLNVKETEFKCFENEENDGNKI